MKNKPKKGAPKKPETPKVGRKRSFSIALRTRPLRADTDTVDIQIIIKLPNDINGKKLSSGLKCPRDSLNTKTWEIKQNSVDTEILRTMRENVKRAYLANISAGKRLDYQLLFDSAFGVSQQSQISVIQAIERFLSKEYLSKASDWKEATAIKNQQRVNVLKEFFTDNFKQKDVYFDQLKPQTADDLVEWAKLKRQNGTDTAVRLVKLLKRVINFAIANEWTTHNPFLTFKVKQETKEIVALNDEEIDALINLNLTTKTMQQTRDLFVFCVFTCLAYADLENLKYGNISVVSGHPTIIVNRQKRGNSRAVVPILADAERILKQYEPKEIKDETPCFQVPTNQSCNRVLKELGGMAGIKKTVHWHTARKSGASYLLNKGVPIEIVQKICGHKSVKITQSHYAKMHDETVINSIMNIFGSKKSNQV
jgi:site-specific recombinase XerD